MLVADRLVDLGQLRLAMELSLELMAQGSYQVEASNEGLMTDDIEECLKVVVQAARNCDLPASELITWCRDTLQKDRVGFICDEELRALQEQYEASRPS